MCGGVLRFSAETLSAYAFGTLIAFEPCITLGTALLTSVHCTGWTFIATALSLLQVGRSVPLRASAYIPLCGLAVEDDELVRPPLGFESLQITPVPF